MKISIIALASALALTAFAAPALADGPAAPPAAAPHFSAPTPTTKADMKQIQAAATRSFNNSAIGHGLTPGVTRQVTVTVGTSSHPAGFIGSGFPRVSAVASAGPGMYNPRQLQPQASAQFTAMKTFDPKTGAESWKLTPVKNDGKVWNRLYTLTGPASH